MADGGHAGVVRADHSVCRLGQVEGALLADDFALDIIAVMREDERFYVNADAGLGGQVHDLRVLEALAGVARGAREDDLCLDVVLAQQPAQHVDLMDHGVLDRHIGGKADAAVVIVAMCTVQHQRAAIFAGIDELFELLIAGIKAAHKANLYEVLARSHLGLHDALAGLRGRRERLLTENRLARLNGCHDILLMEGICRGADDCFHLIRSDHRFAALKCLDAILVCNRLAEIQVRIGTSHDAAALQAIVDALNMGAADRTGANQTNF